MADNECKHYVLSGTMIRPLCGAVGVGESRWRQTYVFEHLMPIKVEDSKNKRWYWMKYIAEEIDFWTCNNAYKELYDRQDFQETIKKCQCSFGTGVSYRFKVRLTYAVVKHK